MRAESGSASEGSREGPAPARRDASGVAAASLLAVVSLVAVLAGLIVFVITGDHRVEAAAIGSSQAATTPSATPHQTDPVHTDPVQTSATRPPPTIQAEQPAHHHTVSHATKPLNHHTQAQPGAPARDAYVEVYNNSAIKGLAERTAVALQDVGWQVVATDNWYGNIPSNTVYYPAKLKSQANLLAKDLGIPRTHPAVAPMRFDRLTVILTGHL
jgi:hypothetical protein